MLRVAIVLLALSFARPALADSDDTDNKSLGVAMGLSVGGTIGGLALFGGALEMRDSDSRAIPVMASIGLTAALVMPTAGHWYARDSMRDGTLGGYLRLGGGCLFVLGGTMWMVEEKGEVEESSVAVEEKMMLAGLGIIAAGTIVDIALLPRAVHRANSRPAALNALPIAIGSHGGFGLGLSGTF